MTRRPQRRVAVDTGVGHAQVVPDPGARSAATLFIDGFVHGRVDPDDPTRLELDYQDRLATVVLALLPPDDACIVHLGGGAFAVPRAIRAARPEVGQTVFERSGALIGLARRELGLRPDHRLVVRKGDARAGLSRLPDRAVDLVVGDAFVGHDTPRHLTTAEFFAEVARVVGPDGYFVGNIVDEAPWSRLGVQAAAAAQVFGDIAAASARGVARLRDPGNVFLVATCQRVSRGVLRSAGAVARHPLALVPDGRLRALARQHRPRYDEFG